MTTGSGWDWVTMPANVRYVGHVATGAGADAGGNDRLLLRHRRHQLTDQRGVPPLRRPSAR